MMYIAHDGRTFGSYTALCDYEMLYSRTAEERKFWKEEKEKRIRRQKSPLSRAIMFTMLPITLPLCTLMGVPKNAIDAVFGD
jgi:hypothetical protein